MDKKTQSGGPGTCTQESKEFAWQSAVAVHCGRRHSTHRRPFRKQGQYHHHQHHHNTTTHSTSSIVNITAIITTLTSQLPNMLIREQIIAHLCDDSGKWSTKGVFAAISKKWPEPEQKFRQGKVHPGECQQVKVKNQDGMC